MTIPASVIRNVAKQVTKPWTRQRKAEDRLIRSLSSRQSAFHCSGRTSSLEILREYLPKAYLHASGDGAFPVSKRQLYYAVRDKYKQWTGRELSADHFSNNLLVQYINRYPNETSNWKVTADPRGTLTIPNAQYDVRIPCGTLAIENHLAAANGSIDVLSIDGIVPSTWPSHRHGQRYQAVLYIEKEGFEPLLQDAAIAELYDLAILSCKGQSVVAARRFVDEVCRVDGGVPLFVVHDFDKAGFEISQRLTTVSHWAEENDRVAYRFQNKINVTDLGLRLRDVEHYKLGTESVEFKGGFAPDSIATAAERKFLRSNRRVELNAFTSPQFIEWLKSALEQHGLAQRLIPVDDVLNDAYRRALAVARINEVMATTIEEATTWAGSARIPTTLRDHLLKAMKRAPGQAWDRVLYRLAEEAAERHFNRSA